MPWVRSVITCQVYFGKLMQSQGGRIMKSLHINSSGNKFNMKLSVVSHIKNPVSKVNYKYDFCFTLFHGCRNRDKGAR